MDKFISLRELKDEKVECLQKKSVLNNKKGIFDEINSVQGWIIFFGGCWRNEHVFVLKLTFNYPIIIHFCYLLSFNCLPYKRIVMIHNMLLMQLLVIG